MKQANLFSFFKKSTEQNTTAAAPVVPSVSSNQNGSDHAVKPAVLREEEVVDNRHQQPLEAPTIEQHVVEAQAETESKADVAHTIIDNESKETQPPPIIPPSFGGTNNSSSSSGSSSSSSSYSASTTVSRGSSSASATGNNTSNVLTNGSNQLSDYERIREENIRRNQAFLMSLGLAGPDSIKPTGTAHSTARPGMHSAEHIHACMHSDTHTHTHILIIHTHSHLYTHTP